MTETDSEHGGQRQHPARPEPRPDARPDARPDPGRGPLVGARPARTVQRWWWIVAALALGAVVLAWGAFALASDDSPTESDAERAVLLAGLHHSQHPGLGRIYVPVDTEFVRADDGSATAYLHYALGEHAIEEFLSMYSLPEPGAKAALPPDLTAALSGEEPAEAAVLPEPGGGTRRIYVVPGEPGSGESDIYVRATG